METEIYTEIFSADNGKSWDVVTPSHQYNPALIYDEIKSICEYEIERLTDTGAYLSGGIVHTVEIDCGTRQTLVAIKSHASTQGTAITFDEKLVSSLESEVERQLR